MAKHEGARETVATNLQSYKDLGHVGTNCAKDVLKDLKPAPPPGDSRRKK
jgi:hypothetical protein